MNIYSYELKSEVFNIWIYYDDNYIYYIKLPNTPELSHIEYFNKYLVDYRIINSERKIKNNDIFKIKEYLSGESNNLDSINIKIYGSKFKLKVLSACREIEYGSVKTYKDLAVKIGKNRAYQAVGGALNKNPIPIIIPCHRVIGSKGNLVGYAGGLEIKQKLLNLEQK